MVPSPPLAAVVLPIAPGVPPLQIVSPVELIVPEVNVLRTVVAKVLAVPFPQAFEGVTVTLAEVAPTVAVTEFVVPPAVCDQPEGNAQV